MAAAALAPHSRAEIVQFSGEVRAGELYARPLPGGLYFCMLPAGEDGKEGWILSIARISSYRADDFTSIATPPYRGEHLRLLMAFHFLPDATIFRCTGEFRFVLNEQDSARILFMLQNERQYEAREILDLARELGKGAGEF